MDIESSIPGKYIFGHIRKSNTEFYSTVSVKELLLNNKDVLAAGLVYNTVSDVKSYEKEGEDPYIRKSAWLFALLDDDKYIKDHSGDCVYQPCTCTLCMLETYYLEGLEQLVSFETLINKNENYKNHLGKYDTCILYMTICQFEEQYLRDYSNACREYYTTGGKGLCQVTFGCPEFIESLNEFLDMSEEDQLTKYNRMKQVREYIEVPTKVEGIPWW